MGFSHWKSARLMAAAGAQAGQSIDVRIATPLSHDWRPTALPRTRQCSLSARSHPPHSRSQPAGRAIPLSALHHDGGAAGPVAAVCCCGRRRPTAAAAAHFGGSSHGAARRHHHAAAPVLQLRWQAVSGALQLRHTRVQRALGRAPRHAARPQQRGHSCGPGPWQQQAGETVGMHAPDGSSSLSRSSNHGGARTPAHASAGQQPPPLMQLARRCSSAALT